MENNLFKNQFNKIRLLDEMATRLAFYGVKCGNEQFMDYMDLNCGAIPDGDYEQVIDPAAQYQFLALYTDMAENRFAFAVTGLLNINPDLINPIKQFCYDIGKGMGIECVDNLKEAYDIINSFVLDGMPDKETEDIISKENEFVWLKNVDAHKASWDKVNGNFSIYYELLQDFVNGLLSASNIRLYIENCNRFILKKS